MHPLPCLFCDHGNPSGAKFCNECGTPLHFKPCPQCDGINGRLADACYRCGAAFSPLAREADEALEVSSQPDAADAPTPAPTAWSALRSAPARAMLDEGLAGNEPASAPIAPPAVPARIPWIPMTAAVVAACTVLGVVAWQTDRALTSDAAPAVAASSAPASTIDDRGAHAPDAAPPAGDRLASATEPDVPPKVAAAPPDPGKRARRARSADRTTSKVATANRAEARRQPVASRAPSRSAGKAAAKRPPTEQPAEASTPAPPPDAPRTVSVMVADGARAAPSRPGADSALSPTSSVPYACAESSPSGACDIRLMAKGN